MYRKSINRTLFFKTLYHKIQESRIFLYIAKKFLFMVLTFYAAVTLTFFMMHAVPGGPFSTDLHINETVRETLNERYGLDDPVFVQYVKFIKNLFAFNLGNSYKQVEKPVNEIIRENVPKSFTLGIIAIIYVVVIAIPLGILSALKYNRWQDTLITIITTLGVTIPSYIIASVTLYFFSVKLDVFPTYGLEGPRSFVLPILALSAYSFAFVARLMRSTLLEVLSQDYIRTARAKGLSEFKVIAKHGIKNALLPVVTIFGPLSAGLISGSFVVERVFAIKGLGKYFVESITNRDYTVIMGVTIFYAFFLILIVFLVDISYLFIDPRIKYE